MRHSREADVIDIAAAPGEQFPVFDAGKGLAEFRAGHRRTVFAANNFKPRNGGDRGYLCHLLT